MDPDTKWNLAAIGIALIVILIFVCLGVRKCNEFDEQNRVMQEFYQWCQKTACPGRELVLCSRDNSLAICKDTSGKTEVVFKE